MPARSAEYMDEMRERILLAALRCIEDKGLANASLTDVCEAAQISRGALYVHFKSKNEMLCGVVDRAAKRALARFSFVDARSLRDMLISDFDGMAQGGINVMYAEMELLAAARTDEPLRDTIKRCRDTRAELFRTGMRSLRKQGELRDDLSEQAAALGLICFFEGMASLSFGTVERREVFVDTVNALLAGLLKPKALRALSESAATL